MSLPLRLDAVQKVFHQDQNLKKRIIDAIEETPHYAPLFLDIAQYCEAYWSTSNDLLSTNGAAEPALKKRKLENGAGDTSLAGPETSIFKLNDVSFSMPQRKKLRLEVVRRGETAAIRGVAPATGAIEFETSATAFKHALKLPVPEKAQKQRNYCLLPSAESLLDSQPSPQASTEPIVWTINDGPLKNYESAPQFQSSPPEAILEEVLRSTSLELTHPNEAEFASAKPESHRKNEKAYHVRAFKGSKEGYLFFVSTGIFFGFKKPLLFFPFDIIDSTSYTSVLQRTFNLNISFKLTSSSAEAQEVEFSMLDQSDFAGIDAYVKRHGLQDASMAEARRAKKFSKENAAAKAAPAGNGEEGAEGGEDDDDDGRTELQKAEQELDDEEDALEEDFEPSDEDDGSESESESQDDEGYDAPGAKGRDLVRDELGSEAEDVSVDEDEDEGYEEGDEHDEEDEDEVEEVQAPPKSVLGKAIPSRVQRGHPVVPVQQTPFVKVGGMPDLNDDDQL